MTIQSPAPAIQRNQHGIVEPHICDFEFDGIEYSAYGAMNPDGPELIQVGFKGSPIDLFPMLSDSHFSSLQNCLAWIYLKK